MTPSLSISIYGLKQDVWFRNTELNYNCRLFKLMTAGGNGKGGGNREQEISTISRNLKALAKELNVPVIAFPHYRAVETRGSSKDLYYRIYVNRGD
jgi:hypothetical protein